jgi:hypothetical protein
MRRQPLARLRPDVEAEPPGRSSTAKLPDSASSANSAAPTTSLGSSTSKVSG